MWNYLVSLAALVALALVIKGHGWAVSRAKLDPAAARQPMHMLAGSVVLGSWLFYDGQSAAGWCAAFPTLAVAGYLYVVGLRYLDDPATVQALSETGEPEELHTHGPLFHYVSMSFCAALYWQRPEAVAAMAVVIFGGGFGRLAEARFETRAIPWNDEKSVGRTVAGFVAAFLAGYILLWVFNFFEFIDVDFLAMAGPLALVALAGTVADSIVTRRIDSFVAMGACLALGRNVF